MLQPFCGPVVVIFEPYGEFGALVNFADIPIQVDGLSWPTVEHFYQAQKFVDPADRERVRATTGGAAAKNLVWGPDLHGRVRPGWDDIRLEIMRQGLDAKFTQSETARNTLKASWPLPLVENSPSDSFWGIGRDGLGENRLGRMLEEIRATLGVGASPLHINPALPLRGTGGWSSTRWTSVLMDVKSEVIGRFPELSYTGFENLSLPEMYSAGRAFERSVSVHVADFRSADMFIDDAVYGRLMDQKYGSYTYYQDARSVIAGWRDRFLGVLASSYRGSLSDAYILAVGAGSANEAGLVWADAADHAILVDCGIELTQNCRREAPKAKVLQRRAEDLRDIPSAAVDVYCSLRTFDSSLMSVPRALAEAFRVIRPDGTLMLSVSNAYLCKNGSLSHGQIGPSGNLDKFRPWSVLLKVAALGTTAGFRDFRYFDLGAEIGICASR